MFATILVALDLEQEEQNRLILNAAKDLAVGNKANVLLLTVIPAGPAIVSQYLHESYERLAANQAEKELLALAGQLDPAKGTVSCLVRFGAIYEEVLAASAQRKADLIVVGCHKPEIANFLLGSNAARIVRHAACSVLVIR